MINSKPDNQRTVLHLTYGQFKCERECFYCTNSKKRSWLLNNLKMMQFVIRCTEVSLVCSQSFGLQFPATILLNFL